MPTKVHRCSRLWILHLSLLALLPLAEPAQAANPNGTSTPLSVSPPADSSKTAGGTEAESPIGGYGEATVVHQGSQTEATFRRFVLSLDHDINDWARIEAELEVEDAHEVELEEGLVELSRSEKIGLRAGLIAVPMGIINLSHVPPSYNGVDRPLVDQIIIPSTWREMGIGMFGILPRDVRYQVYLMNGLDAARISPEQGIGPARGQGEDARARNMALAARVTAPAFGAAEFGVSGYFGGAGQGTPGLGGVNVGVVEADLSFKHAGFTARTQYVHVMIHGAERVTAYLRKSDSSAAAIGSAEYGFYAEAGYNLFHLLPRLHQELECFARYETLNTRASIPEVASASSPRAGQFVFMGLSYRPDPHIVFKGEYRRTLTKTASVIEVDGNRNQLGLGVGFAF